MCNLHIETHFFIFSSFTFFTEKTTKNRCKAASGKKGRKTRPEDPPETRFGTQNRRKSTSEAPKSPNFPEKVDFLTVRFLTVFSSTEKNGKKPKKGGYMPATFRNDGLRRARRRGKERQALRVRQGVRTGFGTPTPRRGTANSIATRIPPSPLL